MLRIPCTLLVTDCDTRQKLHSAAEGKRRSRTRFSAVTANIARNYANHAQPVAGVSGKLGGVPGTLESSSSSTSNNDMKLTAKITLASFAFVAAAALSQAAPVAENWENLCQKCHGADGKGQTKSGKKLQLRDYTDAKVQAELKDEEMFKAIADGVTDKAGKEKMKAYKDEISKEEINELVAYIRKFKA